MMMDDSKQDHIFQQLNFLYGPALGRPTGNQLIDILERYKLNTSRVHGPSQDPFSERDVVLITYGDMLQRKGEAPLETLHRFINTWLKDFVNTIHILPFYPYSSDDGFSVIDYTSVDPALGKWEHIERIKSDGFRLMFDAVINHISIHSDWFRAFQDGDPRYKDYFITVDPETDLSRVTRPRAHPLLTPFETARGKEHVWTTFSPDQADLNYRNPDTLLDVIKVLLTYIDRGADIIRLDAVAYLWKEIGTSCIHRPQTHAIIQLLRTLVDTVAPGVLLITETNVPHRENISYFGNGSNEAHLVYNFTLPPLTAHAIFTGSAEHLTQWAQGLEVPAHGDAFFNFTASHDGVGLMPLAGILSRKDVDMLVRQAQAGGGAISYKKDGNSSISPYELNISYFDLLNGSDSSTTQELQVERFIVSQAIMLALAGVPGIYLHSLLGSRSYPAGVKKTGQVRTINREKLAVAAVESALQQAGDLRSAVFQNFRKLLELRLRERAFHPESPQRILHLDPRIFVIERQVEDSQDKILALHNVSSESVTLSIPCSPADPTWTDLLTGKEVLHQGECLTLEMSPYQVSWLKNAPGSP
ncbi:MAG: alpha-amylase family glycosyl hydrolase [Anaerolineales bacterium]|nr:alpha-amylase family glycosyl hydrolase [Anaerolineales bacterium]